MVHVDMIAGVEKYYATLGLWPGATPDDIRRAYRDLVQVWHPDRFAHNPDLQRRAEERLKEINESYSELRAKRGGLRIEAQKRAAAKRYSAEKREEHEQGPKKALILEDAPGSRRSLREFLEGRGYKVLEVTDGDRAFAAFLKDRPDVVFICIDEKRWAIQEVVKRLKALDPEIPIVVESESGRAELEGRSRAEGAFFLSGPLKERYLGLAIKARFGLRGSILDITV